MNKERMTREIKEANDALHVIMDTMESHYPGFPKMDRSGKLSDIHILARHWNG